MAFWAALAPILAQMGASMGSTAINNAMSEDGEQGYDMPMLTNSPRDAANQRLMSEMAQQNAINSMAGKLPRGADTLLEQIRKRTLAENQRLMYGSRGDRGGSIMDNTMSMAGMRGSNEKAGNALASKAMGDYANRNSQIMNYIDSLKFSGLQDNMKTSFNQMNSVPRSDEIPYTGRTVQMNTPGQSGGVDLSKVDWNDVFEKMAGGGGDAEATKKLAGISGYLNDYDTVDPYAGGGYVMGNQQPWGPPATQQYVPPQNLGAMNGPQNYSDMYGVPAPSQLPGYGQGSGFQSLEDRQAAGNGYTFGWQGGR
jgi:hypothetical protein